MEVTRMVNEVSSYLIGMDCGTTNIKAVILSGDGKIDENDMTYAGDFFSEIPELYGGININLGWKGFDFAISGYGMTHTWLAHVLPSDFPTPSGTTTAFSRRNEV